MAAVSDGQGWPGHCYLAPLVTVSPSGQAISQSVSLATTAIQLQDRGLREINPYGAVSLLYQLNLSALQKKIVWGGAKKKL